MNKKIVVGICMMVLLVMTIVYSTGIEADKSKFIILDPKGQTISKNYIGITLNDLDGFKDLGEVIEIESEIENENLKYKEKRNYLLKQINYNSYFVNTSIQSCNYSDSPLNTTIDSCWNITSQSEHKNTSSIISKVLQQGEVVSLEYESKIYPFDTRSCWVCGIFMACLSNKDGGSSVQFRSAEFKCDSNNRPIIRSGESGYILNLQTESIIEMRSDVGEI